MYNNGGGITMNEEFVTLETAKLLKEKGFKEDVFTFYEAECVEGDLELFESYEVENFHTRPDRFSAPPQSIAQKWLREIKGVYVWVEPVIGKRWKVSFCDFNVPTEDSDWMENEINKGNGYPVYDTYEKALEAGILEALKLI